jgi:hypothetical protein
MLEKIFCRKKVLTDLVGMSDVTKKGEDFFGYFFTTMGNLPQKMYLFFFWAYFIRIAKSNNFVEEFFSIRALFAGKTRFENSKVTAFPVLWKKINRNV